MAELIEIETGRLRLRQWRLADREPFAALNADPLVMEYFSSPLTRVESDAMADRCRSLIEERGWGFWATDGLFELRARGRSGAGRVMYCVVMGRRVVVLHAFIKKSQQTPDNELKLARKRLKEVRHE